MLAEVLLLPILLLLILLLLGMLWQLLVLLLPFRQGGTKSLLFNVTLLSVIELTMPQCGAVMHLFKTGKVLGQLLLSPQKTATSTTWGASNKYHGYRPSAYMQ